MRRRVSRELPRVLIIVMCAKISSAAVVSTVAPALTATMADEAAVLAAAAGSSESSAPTATGDAVVGGAGGAGAGTTPPAGDAAGSPLRGFPVLQALASELGVDVFDPKLAPMLDDSDPLKKYREQFLFPPTEESAVIRKGEEHSVYLCGNSLGLQPRRAKEYIHEELDKWAEYGVEGHFKTERPWVTIDDTVDVQAAGVLGCTRDEVVVMNTLTVNLHLMMVSFYRPTATRYKILVEAKAFPSDAYACQSQVRFHGHDPKDAIIEVHPREGEELIRTEDILAAIEEHGDSIATVLFSAVQYYTGQLFDIEAITAAGHAKGCIVGIDLAHATGNVPLKLHDWGVDFAPFCSYKYLNSGPGGIAGTFVHERHHKDKDLPRFAGWWGHRKEDRFMMHHEFHPSESANGWQLSNPPVWQCASLRASLDLFHEVGMPALRTKSELLTGYLEALLKEELSDSVSILTSSNIDERGAQLSLVLRQNVKRVYALLQRESVIVDVREPHAMRVAPAPFYNSFGDVRSFVTVLKSVLAEVDAEVAAAAGTAETKGDE